MTLERFAFFVVWNVPLFTHPQLTWNIVMMQWWMTPARCSHEIVGGDDRGLDGCGDMVHCGWGDIPSLWCLHCKSGPRPPGMLTHDVSTPALSCGGHSTDPLLHRWAIKCLSSFFIVWHLKTSPMTSVIQVLEAVGFIIGQFLGNLSVVFYPSLIYQIPSSSDNIQYWDSIGAFHCSSSLNSQVGAGYKIAGDIFLQLTVECIH